MANQFGYADNFTDRPEMWSVDGYAVITNGSGNAVIQTNQLQTTGSMKAVQQTSPSSTIKDITRLGTGHYKIHLNQTWVELGSFHVSSVIDPSLSPTFCFSQVEKNTVGNTSFGPGQSELQYVQFLFCNGSGTATELPSGAGFHFSFRLKNSSA